MIKTDKTGTIPNLSGKFTNHADTDFRPEIIAASLVEQGYSSQFISIIRDGFFRRGFSKETENVELNYSLHELQDQLYIRSNREGIYDMLPQRFFHQPIYKSLNKDKEDALEEIRIHREEEFFARKFFRLFEDMADRTLVDACLYEALYDRKISNPEFVELFISCWPIIKLLKHKQALFFMHIIPILHKVRTHYKQASEAISLILDAPVKIGKVKLPAKKADRYFESRIGENQLGVNLVQGSSFDDGEFDLRVTVGPISAHRMLDFIEPANGYRLLDELCELFLPADRFIIKEFKILPEESTLILSDEKHTTFLGVNSFI